MTPKERAAMQQALEALLRSIPDEALLMYVPEEADEFHRKAITALREALGNSLKPKCFADYQPNHAIDRACASCPVAAECQTGEQAEQEPVAYVYEKDVAGIGMRKDVAFTKHVEVGADLYAAPVKQAEQEPIGEVDPYMDFLRINWKDDKHPPRGTKLYASPVRTKDLTVEELNTLWDNAKGGWVGLFRAIIAADREKNRG